MRSSPGAYTQERRDLLNNYGVIPAEAGIQGGKDPALPLDPRVRGGDGGGASGEGGEDLLDCLQLVAGDRGRHEDRRRDAGFAPLGDPVAYRGRAPEERRIGEPAVAHQPRQIISAPGSEGALDRRHLL